MEKPHGPMFLSSCTGRLGRFQEQKGLPNRFLKKFVLGKKVEEVGIFKNKSLQSGRISDLFLFYFKDIIVRKVVMFFKFFFKCYSLIFWERKRNVDFVILLIYPVIGWFLYVP